MVGLGIYGFVYAIASHVRHQEEVERGAERFLSLLRSGDVESAYAQLSARRRAWMSLEAFAALTEHPAFRRHQRAKMGRPKSKHPGTCLLGELDVDGGEWAIQLFFLEEHGAVRIHSFGLQPPARVQLGELIHECGYWSGTRVGYSGPEVERVTPPTPL